jgi:hypothetical protein
MYPLPLYFTSRDPNPDSYHLVNLSLKVARRALERQLVIADRRERVENVGRRKEVLLTNKLNVIFLYFQAKPSLNKVKPYSL